MSKVMVTWQDQQKLLSCMYSNVTFSFYYFYHLNNKWHILSVCLSVWNLSNWAAGALHIIPFWNKDDPRIENLGFSFGARGII